MDKPFFRHVMKKVFDPPPDGFDPTAATATQVADLQRYGLMLPPDPGTRPASHAFWQEFYTGIRRYDPANIAAPTPRDPGQVRPVDPVGPIQQIGGRRSTGQYWSGAIVTPRDGRMFTGVRGKWQVSEAQPPAGLLNSMQTAEDGTLKDSCSTWIGLDGARNYLHSSLPQIGVLQRCIKEPTGPELQYRAWWEWWCAGYRSKAEPLPLDVRPGDVIMCALELDSPTLARFHIKNQTTGILLTPFQVEAPCLPPPGVLPDDGNPVSSNMVPGSIQRVVSGATAEWVSERPGDSNSRSGDRLPLINFGEIKFEYCIASGSTGPGSNDVVDQDLNGAMLRDIIDTVNNRTVVLSEARFAASSTQSVVTSYRGP